MKNEKIISITSIILSLFGLLMIFSASFIWAEYRFGNPLKFVTNQAFFLIAGIILMKIISKIDYKIYKKNANIIMFMCLILLILVLIPGIGSVRNGSRSWFGIGGFGIQPSEIAKLGLIIFVSKYLSRNDKEKRNVRKFVLPIMLVIMSFFALIMLEPDFGSGFVIVASLSVLIFITGSNVSIFVKLGILGLLGIVILILIAPYRMDRILSFLNPWKDPLGTGFQIIQSLYAIGPGGLLGFGFLNSRQKHFYLPEPQTDFIFSIIAEEFGFIGCFLIVSLFIILFYNSIKIALKEKDLFAKYLVFGFSFMLIFQTLLNLMVVVGIVPVTGVTLPFISYGGSSLITSFIFLGIILNVSKHQRI